MSAPNPFNRNEAAIAAYDEWYDSPAARSVLDIEVRCVQPLLEGAPRPWVELGAGTGRFGQLLGADLGIDPVARMLRLAARRLPSVAVGVGEALPLHDASVGGILAVTVLEFVVDPVHVLRELTRALSAGGRSVIGLIPRDSRWGAAYVDQGRDPRSAFHGVEFFSPDDFTDLATRAGLRVTGVRSGLFGTPGEVQPNRIESVARPGAGFVAIGLERADDLEGGSP